VHVVRTYIDAVIRALGLPLEIQAEVGIKSIRPDIMVICVGLWLVGVVEVKKHGRTAEFVNALEHRRVLGELFDQLLLVEGFYCCGPASPLGRSGWWCGLRPTRTVSSVRRCLTSLRSPQLQRSPAAVLITLSDPPIFESRRCHGLTVF